MKHLSVGHYVALFFILTFLLAAFIFSKTNVIPFARALENKLLVNETDNGIAIVVDETVNMTRYVELAAIPYDELKTKFDSEKDFVVYFVDENENVVWVGDKPCMGSPRASVAGHSCG